MIVFKQLHPDAKLPRRQRVGDAGLDLFCIDECVIAPGRQLLIPIGIACVIPRGYYGRVASRSGLSLKGIESGAGVIDNTYRGEIKVVLRHLKLDGIVETIKAGSAIAQLIVTSIDDVSSSELDNTDRGIGGFGSSDR